MCIALSALGAAEGHFPNLVFRIPLRWAAVLGGETERRSRVCASLMTLRSERGLRCFEKSQKTQKKQTGSSG